jgi:hypothetical protein
LACTAFATKQKSRDGLAVAVDRARLAASIAAIQRGITAA